MIPKEGVKGVAIDSRKVKKDYVFFALKGTRFDGHDFVQEALKRGAKAVVVEKDVSANDGRIIKVPNTREALGEYCHEFFSRPSEKLKVIGITGTNGKTTSTYLIEAILKEAGFKVGVIGTINYRVGEEILGEGRTTPDPILWHSTLKEFLDRGSEYAVCEVSSHALDQKRIWGTRFRGVAFTNLTQDHLDYHADMEDYFQAKRRLFTDYSYDFALVNADDPYGRRLISELEPSKILSFGREGKLKIKNFQTSFEGSILEVSYEGRSFVFRSSLVGDFQAYNLGLAIAFALKEGISPEVVKRALLKVRVPGRLEVLRSAKGFNAVVDYAHTPDAVEKALKTLRSLTSGRLIAVFGAGGDRDRTKRPLMGRSAERWADLLVITSDNPRSEDPLKIIEDILQGVEDKEKVVVEPDRRKAIETALKMAEEGDTVAILGKGHETYQEIKGRKIPFSDVEVVKEFLK